MQVKSYLKIYKIVLILVILLSYKGLEAQYDMGISAMKLVPQSNLSNPAVSSNYKYTFGFPALSSIYEGFASNGAKYNQMFIKTSQDSLTFEPANMLKYTKNKNNISASSSQQWLSFGVNYDSNMYFSFSISDIVDVNGTYSKNAVDFLANGNGAYVGQTLDLSPLSLRALHYREYAVGMAYKYNEKWTFGIRPKLLFGKSAIDAKDVNLKLSTSDSYYYLDLNTDLVVNTSYPGNDTSGKKTFAKQYLLSSKNMGFGVDLGATYKFDSLWTFSASVVDLGYIKYNRWVKNYASNGDISYKGVDINQFYGLNKDEQDAQWKEVKDSLARLLDAAKSDDAFKTNLTGKVFLGANYKLSEQDNVGGLLRMQIYNGTIKPTFTASYYREFKNRFGITANYTVSNRSYFNLGVGVVANFEPVQIYFVTDNLYGVLAPDDVKFTNFRFGVNFILTGKKS